ncbi:EboA domain-containing protein [Streptomyces chrestomyceticus]|uniref:EboA domain-containing protein n=1 Tax=Streptomyces chrestomyceticus TaxID=68185 RepID=UPI001F4989B0|nr:EboA domain-containing protein [Streptomyces chrestomyceticus]
MLTPEAWMAQLQTALRDRLGGAARAWLDEALDEAAAEARATARAAAEADAATRAAAEVDAATRGAATPAEAAGPRDPASSSVPALSYTAYAPPVWEMRFASAGRHCTRREPPHARDREAAEAARILLLHTARADARTVTRLYEHGTAAERRAVLMALPHLDLGPSARPLVEDALRTNDTRLVAAAVGPYAARHLDAHTWRHAVLKCLFTGVPVTAVAGLAERARGDTELAHMLTAYARERTAAYRPVPADLQRVLDLTAPSASTAPLASPFPSDSSPAPTSTPTSAPAPPFQPPLGP